MAMLNLKDFGAIGDGIADDTVAVQAAVNAAQGGAGLFADAGTYLLTAPIAVSAALTLQGAGSGSTVFKLASSAQDGFVIATLGKISFSGFRVQGKSDATAGSLIRLGSGSPTAPNQFATFRDIWFQSGWRQLTTESASTWAVDTCLFFSPNGRSLTIANTVMTDAGDMSVIGSVFSGKPGTGTAIFQESAGGLRLVGNKVIQYATGFNLSLASGVATSVLFISANSMEAFSGPAINLYRGSGVVFGAAQITGNEISGGYVGVQISPDTGPWMSHVEITGNNIGTLQGGTGIVVQGTQDFIITSNTIGGTGGTGVNIGALTSNGIIAHNTIINYALPINNGHTGSTVLIDKNIGY